LRGNRDRVHVFIFAPFRSLAFEKKTIAKDDSVIAGGGSPGFLAFEVSSDGIYPVTGAHGGLKPAEARPTLLAPAPSAPLADRVGRVIRVKAKPIL
jgi:hypothetical protein